MYVCINMLVVYLLSHAQLLATPWTVACQAPCPMDFLGKNIGVGYHLLLQGIFPIQGLNLGLLHCRQIFHQLNYQELFLEEGMAMYSSILAWRIPIDREAWRTSVHGVAKSQTWLRSYVCMCVRVHTHTHSFYILSNMVYHLNIVPCAIQWNLVLFFFFLLFPAHNSFPTSSGTDAILLGVRIFILQFISFWWGCQQLHFKSNLLTQGHSPSIVTCRQWLAYGCDLKKG